MGFFRLRNDKTYWTWVSMRARCNSPKAKSYKRYGGSGIKVCKRWDSFQNFLSDMGPRPDGMSIDRKDNSKGYSPANCRWATTLEQALNKRTIHMVSINGKTQCLKYWAKESGRDQSALQHHMKRHGLNPQQEVEWRINK